MKGSLPQPWKDQRDDVFVSRIEFDQCGWEYHWCVCVKGRGSRSGISFPDCPDIFSGSPQQSGG